MDSLSIPERKVLHSSMYLGMGTDVFVASFYFFAVDGDLRTDHGSETGMCMLLSKLKFTSIFLLESFIKVEMLSFLTSIARC